MNQNGNTNGGAHHARPRPQAYAATPAGPAPSPAPMPGGGGDAMGHQLLYAVQSLQQQVASLQQQQHAEMRPVGPTFDGPADCEPMGAPRPRPSLSRVCEPYMNPRDPASIYGCALPKNASAKDMCWVETTLRSRAVVPAGGTLRFSIEVKWWFQIQELTNLGEETFATFDLVEIKYGQSNYDLRLQSLTINGESVRQSGIDIRKWNQSSFASKHYPIPACGIDDPVELVFQNITEDEHDLELLVGGPAVLQIG